MSGQTQHFVKVEARGPTSDAAQQDALWMYYQIQSGGEIIFYLVKVNNRNTRTRCEICSKLTIKIDQIPVLVSLLLTLNIFHTLF